MAQASIENIKQEIHHLRPRWEIQQVEEEGYPLTLSITSGKDTWVGAEFYDTRISGDTCFTSIEGGLEGKNIRSLQDAHKVARKIVAYIEEGHS